MVFDIWCTETIHNPLKLHMLVGHALENCQNDGLCGLLAVLVGTMGDVNLIWGLTGQSIP